MRPLLFPLSLRGALDRGCWVWQAGIKTLFRRVWESLPSDGSGLFVLEPQPWSSYRKKYCLTPTTKAHFQAAQLRPEQFTTHLVPCPSLILPLSCPCPSCL